MKLFILLCESSQEIIFIKQGFCYEALVNVRKLKQNFTHHEPCYRRHDVKYFLFLKQSFMLRFFPSSSDIIQHSFLSICQLRSNESIMHIVMFFRSHQIVFSFQ